MLLFLQNRFDAHCHIKAIFNSKGETPFDVLTTCNIRHISTNFDTLRRILYKSGIKKAFGAALSQAKGLV